MACFTCPGLGGLSWPAAAQAAPRPSAPADLPGAEAGFVLVSALPGLRLQGTGGRSYTVPAAGWFYALREDLAALRRQAEVRE